MANIIYDNEIFNRDVKERFLNEYEGEHKEPFIRIFKIACPLEKQLNKDLYDFSIDEIKKVLQLSSPTSINASRQNGYYIKRYVSWGIVEGYRATTINPLDSVPLLWYKQFVGSGIKNIFSEEEVNDVVNNLNNYQDKVIVQAVFEGIYGPRYSELLNLKIGDIDEDNNTVRLTNEYGEIRTIRVSEKCIEYLIKAYHEDKYLKNNGDVSDNIRAPYTDLIDTGYIVKISKTRNRDDGKADNFVILRRYSNIKNYFDLPLFTAQNVYFSGMLKMAKDIYVKKGYLEDTDYLTIGEQFGLRKTNMNGKEQINYYRYKNTFLNVEKIKEVYPDLS